MRSAAYQNRTATTVFFWREYRQLPSKKHESARGKQSDGGGSNASCDAEVSLPRPWREIGSDPLNCRFQRYQLLKLSHQSVSNDVIATERVSALNAEHDSQHGESPSCDPGAHSTDSEPFLQIDLNVLICHHCKCLRAVHCTTFWYGCITRRFIFVCDHLTLHVMQVACPGLLNVV